MSFEDRLEKIRKAQQEEERLRREQQTAQELDHQQRALAKAVEDEQKVQELKDQIEDIRLFLQGSIYPLLEQLNQIMFDGQGTIGISTVTKELLTYYSNPLKAVAYIAFRGPSHKIDNYHSRESNITIEIMAGKKVRVKWGENKRIEYLEQAYKIQKNPFGITPTPIREKSLEDKEQHWFVRIIELILILENKLEHVVFGEIKIPMYDKKLVIERQRWHLDHPEFLQTLSELLIRIAETGEAYFMKVEYPEDPYEAY